MLADEYKPCALFWILRYFDWLMSRCRTNLWLLHWWIINICNEFPVKYAKVIDHLGTITQLISWTEFVIFWDVIIGRGVKTKGGKWKLDRRGQNIVIFELYSEFYDISTSLLWYSNMQFHSKHAVLFSFRNWIFMVAPNQLYLSFTLSYRERLPDWDWSVDSDWGTFVDRGENESQIDPIWLGYG